MTPIGPASAAQYPRIPVDTSVPKSRLQNIDQQTVDLAIQELSLREELAAISSATALSTTPYLSRDKLVDMVRGTREEIENLKKEKEAIEQSLLLSTSIPIPLRSSSRTEDHSAQRRRIEEPSEEPQEHIDLLHTFLPPELLGKIIHECDQKTLQNLLLCSKAERNSILANMGPKAAVLFVTANPDNYIILSRNNPSSTDPIIIHRILKDKPALFFELSEALQNDPVLRMTSYLCAHLVNDQATCQRLIQFDKDHQPNCLSTFAAQVNQLNSKYDFDKTLFERHPELANNLEAMSALIISTDGSSLYFASDALKKNPTIVLMAVTQEGIALLYASPELKNDPTIVLAAVTQWGQALRWCAPRLQNDPKIVLAAVTNDGFALMFADPELQDNPEIVQAAIAQDPSALRFASPRLRKKFGQRKVFHPKRCVIQ